ncbi:MAG TPA: cupin domain-containing protein, partial [Thermomicrobiales bacterium]|nr:cupin domain-containing protein [Thermomicrobiales bacterium]
MAKVGTRTREPGQGRTVWVVNQRMTFKVTGEETGGAFALWEDFLDPGEGPPPHVHANEDEAFYILEGEYTFTVGERALTATAGSFVLAPKGIPHGLRNTGDTPGRMLVMVCPAGVERYFFAVGTAGPPTGPPDIERIVAAAGEYG